MKKAVVVYDMYTNEVLAEHASIIEASKEWDCNINTVWREVTKKVGTERPCKDFYFRLLGDEPTRHKIYRIYNEYFEEIDVAYSVKDASEKMGINYRSVWAQLNNPNELRNRKLPTKGKYVVLDWV